MGLHDRGRIAEGQAADITIFDARTIIDRSTWDDPAAMATGVKHVLVGGTLVLRDERMTGEAPGRYLAARH